MFAEFPKKNLAYMALGGHINFAFPLSFPSDSCIHGAWRDIKFTFSLRFPTDACIHGAWRPHQILTFVASPKRFLHAWRLAGTSIVACFSSLVWGILFHRFGRCANHDDFLEEFVTQGAPKLVLVTLALFGPLGRNALMAWGKK